MRKLAQEAVIFMFVTAALSGIGTFAASSYIAFHSIQTRRREVKKECDAMKFETNAYLVGVCVGAFGELDGRAVPDTFGRDELSGERLEGYDKGWKYGLQLKPEHEHVYNLGNAHLSLIMAGIGFLAGLVLWLPFRLVVFAINWMNSIF